MNSWIWYNRSKEVLAGPSTFSKNIDLHKYGITPFALKKGLGCIVYDVDENAYIDMMMGMGTIILGYKNPHVNDAIRHQLLQGISFSIANTLEVEVAEKLCKIIPSAELVRFGKNGNDVTSAAIRLCRHITQKEHVLFCGYHGWQDWYSCKTSMNSGIPDIISRYSHRFRYNHVHDLISQLDKYKNNTACIILEPIGIMNPDKNYLRTVRNLADEYDTLLVFDEITSGFRFHRGGYQKICKVTPDLSCFGKALGNGMPISALVGKEEYMKKCPEIYFSLTNAGETLSLAAANAVNDIFETIDVPTYLKKVGGMIMKDMKKRIIKNELHDKIKVEGFPCRHIIRTDEIIRTFIIQELANEGVLSNGFHMMSYAHDKSTIEKIGLVYDFIFRNLKVLLEENRLKQQIRTPISEIGVREKLWKKM